MTVPQNIRVKTPDGATTPREQPRQPQPPRRRSRSRGPRPRSRSRGPRPRSRSRGPGSRTFQPDELPVARRKSLSGVGPGMPPSKSYNDIREAYGILQGDAGPSRGGLNRSYNELLDARELEGGPGKIHRSYDELLVPNPGGNRFVRGNSDGSSAVANRGQRHDTSTIDTSNNFGMNARDMGQGSAPKDMRRRKSFNELVVPVEGYASDNSGNVGKNNFQGRRIGAAGDGGYNPLSDGGYASSGSELAKNNSNQPRRKGGFQRRTTHDGSFTLGLSGKSGAHSSGSFARAFASQRRGSISGSDASGDLAGGIKRRGSMGNLRSLPEDKSLRNLAAPVDLDDAKGDGFMSKNLDSMTLEELQAELKVHGIAVQGMFNREDLAGVCLQARKRWAANMYRPVSRNNSSEDLKNRGQSQQQPQHRRSSSGNLGPLEGNANTSRRRPSYGPRRKRRTVDSRDSAGFSANPQQGMRGPTRASTTAQRGSDVQPPSGRISRQSSRSSLSSIGAGLEEEMMMNEMTVLNAPLGVGLSGIGYDVENPNQQMGLLMQQMQALEDQMNAPQDEPAANQHKKMPRRMSGHSAASGAAHLSVQSSRRLSKGSGASSGFLGSGGGATPPRRMSFGSHRSGGSWYVGTDPSGRSGPPTRNSSRASLELLASDNAGDVKDLSRRTGSGGAPSDANIDWAPAAAPVARGATNGSDEKTEALSAMSSVTGKHASDAKKPLCSTKAKLVGVALLLIVAGGALAASLILLRSNDDEGSEVASPSGPQLAQYPEAPPSDIEGRCSPSNLPGSLSACLSACLPSSCCYPLYSKDQICISENDQSSVDACNQYRPYCDIFYDSWPGATEGVLRSPPENLVRMCVENAGRTGDRDNNLLGESMKSAERKRLRHHVTQGERILSNPDQICSRHCTASRCCHAPVSTDGLILSASGVFTDAVRGDHVMTNCASQFGANKPLCEEYDKFCDYSSPGTTGADDGTRWTGRPTNPPAPSPAPTASTEPSLSPTKDASQTVWTSRPIQTPPSSLSSPPTLTFPPSFNPLRPSSTPTSSAFPTSSKTPTKPPNTAAKPAPANTLEIAEACSGTDNFELISFGDLAARTKCISACQNGLCCYSEMLGYGSWMPSCYAGNEGVCVEYYPCLALVQGDFVLPPSDPEDITTTPATTTSAEEALPTPPENLAAVCSQNSLSTAEGLGKCISACQPASCCDVQMLGEDSCYFDNKEICDRYSPCINLNGPSATEDTQVPPGAPPAQDVLSEEGKLPPEAPSDLAAACSYESLAADGNSTGTQCFELCAPGSCCGDGLCLDGDANVSQSMIDGICETYSPCTNLWLLNGPPSNLGELCNDNSTSAANECVAICSAVSCCFIGATSASTSDASTSCYVHFEESCTGYAPYCAPALPPTQETIATATSIVNLPPTPPDLAALCSFSPEFCKNACQVASCCFESSADKGCSSDNEERCEEYAPCAALFDQEA